LEDTTVEELLERPLWRDLASGRVRSTRCTARSNFGPIAAQQLLDEVEAAILGT